MLGFRVWDIQEKIFCSGGSTRRRFINSNGKPIVVWHINKKTMSWAENDPTLFLYLQSTGSFDINKKEIFEGDIVVASDGPNEICFEVKSIPQFYSLINGDSENIKLICLGSKYDDPELLIRTRY